MIRWIFKYSAVIFIFNTVLFHIDSTKYLADIIFFGLMGLYAIILLMNINKMKIVIFHKAFLFLLIITCLNFLYFIIFHSFNDIDAINYLLARTVQFSIFSVSIFFSYEYYKEKFLDHFIYFTALILFLGFIVNPYIFSGRYTGLLWNPNMLSSLVTLAFSILLLKNQQFTRMEYFLLFLFLLVSIATGSRGSLVAIVLAAFLKYGYSKRNFLHTFIIIISALIFIALPFETSFNRFASASILDDRLLQYKFALSSISEKLFVGYGLDKYSYINMNLVPSYLVGPLKGAHNGYLAILTQYGIIFGSIVLFIIIRKSIDVILFFRKYSGVKSVYLFIVIYALIAAIYESLITGINELHTSLFWFALSFLSLCKFKKEYGH